MKYFQQKYIPQNLTAAALIILSAFSTPTWADTYPNLPYQSELYSDTNNWLCHPDQLTEDNTCLNNLDTLIVNADGSEFAEPFVANEDAPVDCFYVYPTASIDLRVNSDLNAGQQEIVTTRVQAGLYSKVCRVFAPLYRQRTLTMLGINLFAGFLVSDEVNELSRETAYGDVLDAFKHYLANYNDGRGIILVGHSQGSGVLSRLIREEFENSDYLSQLLISAHLPGATLAVPVGHEVGGSFSKTPVCNSKEQTGCVVSFVSYRENDPFLENPAFGLIEDENFEAICVNPADLTENSPNLDVRLPLQQAPITSLLVDKKGSGGPYPNVYKNFFKSANYSLFNVPGKFTGQCQRNDLGVHYLEVTLLNDAGDQRASEYEGELWVAPNWGLHLLDVSLAMGDLLTLAESQIESWLANTE